MKKCLPWSLVFVLATANLVGSTHVYAGDNRDSNPSIKVFINGQETKPKEDGIYYSRDNKVDINLEISPPIASETLKVTGVATVITKGWRFTAPINFTVRCRTEKEAGITKVAMRSMSTSSHMQLEYTFEGTDIKFPLKIEVGE